MNAFGASFGFTIEDGTRTLSLRANDHVRMYPKDGNGHLGSLMTERQIDLGRLATAIFVADRWARRSRRMNGHRDPTLSVEVLDRAFWSRPETDSLLRKCVDFVSGEDEWTFRFLPSSHHRHERQQSLLRGIDKSAVVCLYSGGLDSAAGLAARLEAMPGRTFIPVTVRHQMQKAKLVRDHFEMLTGSGLVRKADLHPLQVGAFVRNSRMKQDFGVRLMEHSHRCRSMLFMVVAGLVAAVEGISEVEVYESGVGAVNLPLTGGASDSRTTRSTHPNSLRLLSELLGHVNGTDVRFVLPFVAHTKAEMVGQLKRLGLRELARSSVSCVMHPLRRRGSRQCGHCAACVFRRQAMLTAGIAEDGDAYDVDLFSSPSSTEVIPESCFKMIRAFHQQVARLAELDSGRIPRNLREHLWVTNAVNSAEEVGAFSEVYRRYYREWTPLFEDARRRSLPWMSASASVHAQGAVA